MDFNPYIWQLYRLSESGRKTIEDFTLSFGEFRRNHGLDEYAMPVPDSFPAPEPSGLVTFSLIQTTHDACLRCSIDSIDDAVLSYNELVANGIPLPRTQMGDLRFGTEPSEWYCDIDLVSWGLYLACPEYYLPYLFTPFEGDDVMFTFYALEEICVSFGLSLPPIPSKRDKRGKALYYGQLMRACYEFRVRHRLNPAEMCAFLYDFGINVVQPMVREELPEPSKVWLLKAGRGDFDYLDAADSSTCAYRWGATPDIRMGDILLMYCLSPRSCIQSVWRAISDAYVDPFFHYHQAVAVGGKITTVPVTFREMRDDPIIGKKGLIRSHLQGASGDPFTVAEYDEILSLMEGKGQDVSEFPRLVPLNLPDLTNVRNERDVEFCFVEPLLRKLGYQREDWMRQMPIRMGRGERNYPDYAIGAVAAWGEESAEMVLEAKYRISTRRQLADAFYQAKSYALRLQAKYIALCAVEGIWVYWYEQDGFDIEMFLHKSWPELGDPDTVHGISKRIGRHVVLGS